MKKTERPHLVWRMSGGKRRPFFRLRWQENGKMRAREVLIQAEPDTPEFDAEYWGLRAGRSPRLHEKASQTTWAVLAKEYRSSARYKKLAAGTRRSYDRHIEAILSTNGERDVASLTRAQVRAVHAKYAATPRKADWYVQIISLLLNFARNTLDWKVENVAEGIELFGKQREFEPWPAWMVAKLDEAPESVRTAAELILGTGQRPNAAIMMERGQFRGEWVEVLDEKGGERFEIYCHPKLRAYVEGLPKRGQHVLAKTLRQPLGYDAIEKAFRAWRTGLGAKAKPYSLHGLRKVAIIRLAEAGCTDAQIQAVTNQSAEMVRFYRQKASRRHLSRAAITRGTDGE